MVEGPTAMKATANSMRASRRLRRTMTKPEAVLWRLLRGSPNGIRFRRQYAIGPYVADFYCPAARLVIEIDGQIHDFAEQARLDVTRDETIAAFGVRVQRIAARDVLADAPGIAAALVELCRPLHQPAAGPPPQPRMRSGARED